MTKNSEASGCGPFRMTLGDFFVPLVRDERHLREHLLSRGHVGHGNQHETRPVEMRMSA